MPIWRSPVPLIESLHAHTRDTDGHQSHIQVLSTAEALGYGVIAFTDHDWLPSPNTMKQLRDYDGPLKWLLGIELSAFNKGTDEKPHNLHVLGYFFDPEDRQLGEYLLQLEQGRVERMERYVKHLSSLGFTITKQDCITAAAGSRIIGSPHIVKAIESHPENQPILDRLKNQMATASKHDQDMSARYERMLKEGPRQYPYVLFMKASSFVPFPAGSRMSMVSLQDAIKLIRSAGGIAVLAHWFFNQDAVPKAQLESMLDEKQLDGVETAVDNLITVRDISAESQYLRELAAQHQAIETMGGDSHDAADLKSYASSATGARSIGQTESIIKRIKPNPNMV
jgi:predicted metal-dependent phosphoesterase TrpH